MEGVLYSSNLFILFNNKIRIINRYLSSENYRYKIIDIIFLCMNILLFVLKIWEGIECYVLNLFPIFLS